MTTKLPQEIEAAVKDIRGIMSAKKKGIVLAMLFEEDKVHLAAHEAGTEELFAGALYLMKEAGIDTEAFMKSLSEFNTMFGGIAAMKNHEQTNTVQREGEGKS